MNLSLFTRGQSACRAFIRGFSLVEMMACVSIIGIIAFLAIPSITRMRGDADRNLAIARAEALNLAQASLIQAKGRTEATNDWIKAGTVAQNRYNLLRPYLSYSETTLVQYLPSGYTITFQNNLTGTQKVALKNPAGENILY